jgi:hypothetical protein
MPSKKAPLEAGHRVLGDSKHAHIANIDGDLGDGKLTTATRQSEKTTAS